MTILQGAALFLAAVLAGALNSVAGGGSFISFPALLFVGVPPIAANATNSVALLPGSIASIPPYRKDFAQERRELLLFSVVSVFGGVVGAVVLLRTPQSLFERLIPWLLLVATLIFAFSGTIGQRLRQRHNRVAEAASDDGKTGPLMGASRGALVAVLIVQFVIALYGGFFGGGIGIMMLAALALLGLSDIHAMNALKVVLASVINGVAVIAFAIAGAIFWPQALLMSVGAILGGYGGAALAHRVAPQYVRRFVITVGLLMTAYFFYKQGVLTPVYDFFSRHGK